MTATTTSTPTVTRSRGGAAPSVGIRGFSTLLAIEARVFLRDMGNIFFLLAFPTILLVGVGFAIPGMRDVITDAPPPWEGLTPIATYVPVALATAIATAGLSAMPVYFAGFREKGILRRLATTPMRPQGLIGAHIVINLVAVVVAALIALVVAELVFGLPAPNNVFVVVLSFVLGVLTMFSLGMLVAARAPKGSTASAIGMSLYFPMLFLAGMWTPGPIMPEALRTVAQFSPLGAPAQAMTAGWFEQGFPTLQVVAMLVWIAVLLPLSVRLFRWT